jgi:hypothetical protein
MPKHEHHILPATKDTPHLEWSITKDAMMLSLTGECEPEDAVAWFAPIFEWLQQNLRHTFQEIPFYLHIRLSYCNTSSTKAFSDLIELLHTAYSTTPRMVIATWFIPEDDEDVMNVANELFSEWDSEHFHIHLLPPNQ